MSSPARGLPKPRGQVIRGAGEGCGSSSKGGLSRLDKPGKPYALQQHRKRRQADIPRARRRITRIVAHSIDKSSCQMGRQPMACTYLSLPPTEYGTRHWRCHGSPLQRPPLSRGRCHIEGAQKGSSVCQPCAVRICSTSSRPARGRPPSAGSAAAGTERRPHLAPGGPARCGLNRQPSPSMLW